jgi:hypothetical protein
MNSSLSRPLEPKNTLPDCVFIKLHCAPVRSPNGAALGFQMATAAPAVPCVDPIAVKVTIRFGKQAIKVPGGVVEFGLRRGELALKLENGKMPLEKVALKADFAKVLEVEEQTERGRESEAAIAVAAGVKTKDASKTASKTKRLVSQVHNRGTEEQPIWEFQAHSSQDQPILLGNLTEEPLGQLAVEGSPCAVVATFTIQRQSDIHLFDSSGLIAGKNLSRNKTAWLTREFFLRFIAPKLQPYLSRVEGEV